jgi:hypothetical protein
MMTKCLFPHPSDDASGREQGKQSRRYDHEADPDGKYPPRQVCRGRGNNWPRQPQQMNKRCNDAIWQEPALLPHAAQHHAPKGGNDKAEQKRDYEDLLTEIAHGKARSGGVNPSGKDGVSCLMDAGITGNAGVAVTA